MDAAKKTLVPSRIRVDSCVAYISPGQCVAPLIDDVNLAGVNSCSFRRVICQTAREDGNTSMTRMNNREPCQCFLLGVSLNSLHDHGLLGTAVNLSHFSMCL